MCQYTSDVRRELEYEYDYFITDQEVEESVKVLQGHFVSKDDEYQKYKFMNILRPDGERTMRSVEAYQRCLQNEEFNAQIRDIIKVGLARYKDKYTKGKSEDTPFVLYEKYSRRDVSLLMNCGKDLSSTMYGMSRIGDDVFIFITVKVGDLIDTIEYDYPAFHLSMDCFWCEVASGELKLLEAEAARWLTKEELDSVQWLPADVTLIDKIRKCME